MLLDALQPDLIQEYLRRRGWLDDEEQIVSVGKPGEGNMNYTLRITTAVRTLIVKQSRGYVEKYPTIPAPANRAVVEGRFYQAIGENPGLANAMPQLLGMDEENNILILEDLGAASDYSFLYQPDQALSEHDALALTHYLSALHHHFAIETPDPIFTNQAMRALNHEHMFNYPFLENNGFDLNTVQPGLQELAMPYKRDKALSNRVGKLGLLYLDAGISSDENSAPKTLLHGDFYPGSWLKTTTGPKVIDPEFCFFGPAEFDLGVTIAHLLMAQQPATIIDIVSTNYEKPDGFDETLRQQFTGVEIMRRLIGLAQLPLHLTLEHKRLLLDEARQMM